jgi:hypothetical protein
MAHCPSTTTCLGKWVRFGDGQIAPCSKSRIGARKVSSLERETGLGSSRSGPEPLVKTLTERSPERNRVRGKHAYRIVQAVIEFTRYGLIAPRCSQQAWYT